MSLEKLVNRLVPEKYNVLGIDLKPFCLGHYFLMQKYNCAFISEVEGQAGMEDLLLGLVICSRSYEALQEFLTLEDNSWLDRTRIWQWLCDRFSFFTYHPLSLNQWCKQWHKQVHTEAKKCNIDLMYGFKAFQKYLKEGIEIPSYEPTREENPDKVESGTHWTQDILHVLTKELNFSESYALNMPLSAAFAHYYKFLESNGDITIHTDDDAEAFKEQLNHVGS